MRSCYTRACGGCLNSATFPGTMGTPTTEAIMDIVYAIFTDDGLDIIVHTQGAAIKHKAELVAMDCGKVVIRKFVNEAAVYDWCEKRGISA